MLATVRHVWSNNDCMERLARILFGHERAVFTNGHFGFDVRPRPVLLILLAILLAAFIYFIYIRRRLRLPKSTTATLALLRTALIALVIFMLLRPVVVVSSVIPRSSYVAVVVDDSLSMKLQDMNGQSRLDAVKQTLLSDKSPFIKKLEERFKTELYGFSGELVGLKSRDDLYGEGRSSDLGGAISETVRRSAGIPLS